MKKILGALALVSLVAAGCSSTDSNNNQSVSPTQTETSTFPTPTPTPSMQIQNNSTWDGTLMASDNMAKGKYMITVDGHKIYINTSRDYSKLVGKAVDVQYKGTVDSFTLVDITAK